MFIRHPVLWVMLAYSVVLCVMSAVYQDWSHAFQYFVFSLLTLAGIEGVYRSEAHKYG